MRLVVSNLDVVRNLPAVADEEGDTDDESIDAYSQSAVDVVRCATEWLRANPLPAADTAARIAWFMSEARFVSVFEKTASLSGGR